MGDTKKRVQYPQLKGSEQHHDLKNDPGKKGEPDHVKNDDTEGKKKDGTSDD